MDAAGPLRGTVALVLGASGIVGGGVADGLIKAGAQVLAPCRSESSKAKMMEHLEHSQSPLLEAPVVDYSSEAGLAGLVEYVQNHAGLQGHVDHIFSCQGGSVPKGEPGWRCRGWGWHSGAKASASGPAPWHTSAPLIAHRPALGRDGG